MITIYIVSTGHHLFLEKSIKSVLNQNIDINLHVIETSADEKNIQKSSAICEILGINLILLSNYKLPQVANYILKKTNTPFLMRLDADDWLSNDFLKIAIQEINKIDSDAYVPSYFETDQEGNVSREVSRGQLKESKVKDNPPHGACTIFKTSFLKKIGGYSEEYDRQDGYYIWLKILRFGSFSCMPEAKFYYRQHERNISSNQRELWNVRARMLVDECFNELSKNSCCVIPILEKSSLFGQLTLEPFLGFSTLLEYELNRLDISCKIYVYGPESLADVLPLDVSLIKRTKFSNNQWQDIQDEAIQQIHFQNGYVCIKNIEYPFVNPKYIEAAISAVHLFNANSCITVEELKKDVYRSSNSGLVMEEKGKVKDNDRRYKRSGGIVAKRIIDGIIAKDNLTTSLPAESISAIRVTEMRDFMDLQGLIK